MINYQNELAFYIFYKENQNVIVNPKMQNYHSHYEQVKSEHV